MESLLMLVTILSLVLGTLMSLAAWRLLRQSRQHALARIDALQAMSRDAGDDDEEADEADVEPPPDAFVRPRHGGVARALAPDPAPATRFAALDDEMDAPLERPAVAAEHARAEAAPAWDAIRERPAARAATPRRRGREIDVRFAAADEPRAPGRRWAALAAVAATMVAGFTIVYALYSTDAAGALARIFSAPASASPATAEPLQLLSLRHTTDETGSFILTGLVQNPAAGQPRKGVIAVVYLFDQQGRYFAGGRTQIEVAALHPGEESPFVVRIAGAEGVARYRIGFRMEDGGVVAHVDRRGQLPGGTVEDANGDGHRVLPLPGRSEG